MLNDAPINDPDIDNGHNDEQADAVEVRSYVRTRGRQEGKTAQLNTEARLRGALNVLQRCSTMVEEAKRLVVLADELGDTPLRKQAREHVTRCEDLLAYAIKRSAAQSDA